MKMQHTARLHERTVIEVSKGKKVTPRRGRTASKRNSSVTNTTVRKDVMQAARAIKGTNGYTRIKPVDGETVIVS